MRNFQVTVNGKLYNVAVEETAGGAPAVSAAPATVAAPIAAPATPVAQPAAAAPVAIAGGNTVKAPMPGNIISIGVEVGDLVKNGDVLVVLEAMKMENEIKAPCDGTVVQIATTKGTVVNTDDVLIVLG